MPVSRVLQALLALLVVAATTVMPGTEPMGALFYSTLRDDGAMRFSTPTRLASVGGPTLYPAMASAASGVVAAWTSGAPRAGVIQVRQLIASGTGTNAP